VLALAVALYLVIYFALQSVRVEGDSMVPTLDNGDLLIADKLSYHLHAPGRGDIVILKPPTQSFGDDKDFIKRIVAVPGDVIKIDRASADSQMLSIFVKPNGQGAFQREQEPYLPDQSKDPWQAPQALCCSDDGRQSNEAHPVTVPQDMYLVFGDNRNHSQDSRVFGYVPRDHILGRAWLRLYPFSRFGFLGSGPTLVSAALILPLPLPLWRRRRRRRHAARAAGPPRAAGEPVTP